MAAGWQNEQNAQFNEALKEYRFAEKDFRASGNRIELSKTIFMQALLYKRFDKYDRAATRFHDAIEMCRVLNDHDSLAHAYVQFGEMCRDLKRYDEAEEHYKKAAEAWQQLGIRHSRGFALYHLAITQMEAHKKGEATANFETAIKLLETRMNNDQLADTLLEAGTFEKKMGKQREALRNLAEAEKLYRKIKKADKAEEARKLAAGIAELPGPPEDV